MPFPYATDAQFAYAYARTVSFTLLPGRIEGADPLTLDGAQAARHNPFSRVLQILTDRQVRADLAASLYLLLRVVCAVPPAALAGPRAPWLRFFEDFLAACDPGLRENAGVYYTPLAVARAQVPGGDGGAPS